MLSGYRVNQVMDVCLCTGMGKAPIAKEMDHPGIIQLFLLFFALSTVALAGFLGFALAFGLAFAFTPDCKRR
jgi:hypothetical protein